MKPQNMDFDFSKLSLIQNEFGAHWIHIIGHIPDLIKNLSIITYVLDPKLNYFLETFPLLNQTVCWIDIKL